MRDVPPAVGRAHLSLGGVNCPATITSAPQCDNRFELVQSFKEAGSGICAAYVQGKGRRVFHAVPVIYKGSGFYTTDYGRPKSPALGNQREK